MNKEDLKKLQLELKNIESNFNIPEWKIDRAERMKSLASIAASSIPNELRRKGGLKNVESGHCNRIAHLGGQANSKSGHIQRLQPIATKAASEVNKKEVIKLDKKGNIIKSYSSILEASLDNNRTQSTVSNNIAGRTKYCGGFKYRFK
jgi:hypothetical protein